MTEPEWLACTDPRVMLYAQKGKMSDRKLRLFACACCRAIWHLLPDERSRRAVVLMERWADGELTSEELRAARETSSGDWSPRGLSLPALSAAIAAARATWPDAYAAAVSVVEAAATDPNMKQQYDLLKDILGNPFRPSSPLPSAILAWDDGTVGRMAERIYAERRMPEGTLDPSGLAMLADALEEAGCHDPDMLVHCRQAGEHVRGCWVVDLLLGKE